MTRQLPKYINAYTDRHGKPRVYFRYAGKSTPIRNKVGTVAFKHEYNRILKLNGLAVRRFVQEGYVYFIRADGHIKIGFSTNWRKRIDGLQGGMPAKIQVLHIHRGDRALEARLHQRFAHLSHWGEWFVACPELLDFIERMKNPLPLTRIGLDTNLSATG